MMLNQPALTDIWPSLPLDAWQETYATLHMWTQIIGKIRFAQTPWINHSWHIPFYLIPILQNYATVFSADRI
ncbi:DUF5996 family protein [Microcoleus sp. Pol12A4]